MITAIVLAGGKGKRFGGDVPKQYRNILGKPALYWPLKAFQQSAVDNIILVCGEGDERYCRKEIVNRYDITKCNSIIRGGSERYDSVYAGIKAASCLPGDYVLIHDGARVCIETETINMAIAAVQEKKACVVGVPVTDTIQVTEEDGAISMTPVRKLTWSAQTPQCFEAELAFDSYMKAIAAGDDTITDDAMVVRKYSEASVYMIEGKKTNIKLTTEDDLIRAEEFLKEKQK